eukprot:3125457-Pleurochrysis_carterae.AAC.1
MRMAQKRRLDHQSKASIQQRRMAAGAPHAQAADGPFGRVLSRLLHDELVGSRPRRARQEGAQLGRSGARVAHGRARARRRLAKVLGKDNLRDLAEEILRIRMFQQCGALAVHNEEWQARLACAVRVSR